MKPNQESRRNFLKNTGISVMAYLVIPSWVKGNEIKLGSNYPLHNIPVNKNLDAKWVKSLYQRGLPTTYLKSKNELKYIGMPTGGLHSGSLYLGGDGRLWLWEIFNSDKEGIDPKTITWNDGTTDRKIENRDGANYISPAIASENRILAQGFALKIKIGDKTIIKELREEDWEEISFEATYPLATVKYIDKNLPIEVTLKAGSFFTPLKSEDSSFPATFFNIDIKNNSTKQVDVTLIGWLENGSSKVTAKNSDGERVNSAIKNENHSSIFSSFKATNEEVKTRRDAGSMSLAIIGKNGLINTNANPTSLKNQFFKADNQKVSTKAADEKLIGSISTAFSLKPGKSRTTNYVVAWHFNHSLKKLNKKMPESEAGYYYGSRFKDAAEVVNYIAKNYKTLLSQTFLWQQTFFDSSLPHWFLERTFLNIGTIATANTYRFASGRFWGWEGVNACAGTCTHVWQYGHTLARMFPDLERETRERVDLGVGMRADGAIFFRGEFEPRPAIDGQAGTILRFYREHQMTSDYQFLERNWTNIKKTVVFMLAQDKNGDGMEDTPMENTLDAVWEGEIAWIVGLCIAAAKAAGFMAREVKDDNFARICEDYVEKGNANMAKHLFNGEYFIHRPDAIQGRKKLGSYNTCHIDQVYGQSWAYQVGLGRLWDKEKTVSSLQALWKYNFAPDVGPYIQTHTGGRPYALAGEAGMILNTNPYNDDKPYGENATWQLGYFHECMSGFEHQVAAHMMAEGMVEEALILTRSVHDRYHALKRNPYNEIECSDHYARAMASYGTFITACGFEYHGPKGYISFDPKLSPENFIAPFTAAEGWGTYAQETNKESFSANYTLKFGQLSLKEIGVSIDPDQRVKNVLVTMDGQTINCQFNRDKSDVAISLMSPITVKEGKSLTISIT